MSRVLRIGTHVIDGFVVWKMAVFKAIIGAILAMLLFYTSQDHPSADQWAKMFWLDKMKFWGAIIAIGLKDVYAFIDQTTATIKKEIEDEGVEISETKPVEPA